MRIRGRAAIAVVALLVATPAASAATVAQGVDPARAGFLADEELVPPLKQRWSIPARAATLLVADGRVFVTDLDGAVAFDLATGQRLWATGAPGVTATAYDGGLVFLAARGRVLALEASTGAIRWEVALGEQHMPNAGIVATGGVVYAGEDEAVRALRASDGAQLWRTADVPGLTAGAVDESRLYLAAGCDDAVALDRASGEAVWRVGRPCVAHPADSFPAVHAGRLWSPRARYRADGSYVAPPVHDAATGAEVGALPAGLPIFVDGLAVVSDVGVMRAYEVGSLMQRWERRTDFEPRIAVGHDLYGEDDQKLTAVSAEDGRVLWEAPLPSDVPFDTGPATSLAAAPGVLVTESTGRLTAWESVFKPAPRRVALGASDTDVDAGVEITLTGVLGRDLRGVGVPVRIDAAEQRRGFKRFAEVRAARDGGFSTRATIYRNARFRVPAPGEGSDVVTVYATPRVVVGRPRGGVAGISVRSPRTRLAGRMLVLYRDAPGAAPLVRLAAGTLRSTGPGRTRTRLPLSSRRGRLVFCIRGQLKLGLGRPTALNRRCGARRLPPPT